MGYCAAALVNRETVPLEAVALERGQDRSGRPGIFPGRIDVFDADQPAPVIGAGL